MINKKLFFQNRNLITFPLLIILIYLIFHTYMYFNYAYQMVVFPYDFDAGEGLILHRALDLSEGRNIYTSIDHEPYTVMNYPPFFEIVLSWLVGIFGPKLLWGRLISVCSTFICAYFVSCIVYLESKRKIISAIAGLFFFTSGWLQNWSVLCRHDVFSIALTLAGLYLFLKGKKMKLTRHICFSALCFVGAMFTRQSAIAAPLSCLSILILRCFRKNSQEKEVYFRFILSFLTVLIGASSVLFVLLLMTTNGEFWFHIVKYTCGKVSWLRYVSWLSLFYFTHSVSLFLSASFIVFSFFKRQLSVFLLFWLFSFFVTVTAGKAGSSINYFLEFWAANCILVGLVLSVVFNKTMLKKWYFIILVLVAVCMAFQLIIFYNLSDNVTPSDDSRSSGEHLTRLIRRSSGDVLSEYSGYLAQNDKKIIFQPFSMTQLEKRGLWDQEYLLNDIRKNRFDLVVLSKSGFDIGRWTKEMVDAVNKNYDHLDTIRVFELCNFYHFQSELDIFVPRRKDDE